MPFNLVVFKILTGITEKAYIFAKMGVVGPGTEWEQTLNAFENKMSTLNACAMSTICLVNTHARMHAEHRLLG